jgi:hypothetical protein
MNIEDKVYANAIRVGFVDPITKLPPKDERAISALMCIYHQQKKISWDKVNLLDIDCALTGRMASDIFEQSGSICTEYPLFWSNKEECDAYGDMRPDFVYLSNNLQMTAIIENKLGASDTHSGDQYGGQFGRYIQYLKQSPALEKYIVLLTSRYFLSKTPPWYVKELADAERIQASNKTIKARIIQLDEILEAFCE